MNISVNLLVLSIFLSSVNSKLVPQGRIVGGHEAKPNSHPYIVSLQYRVLWWRLHLCGGALLNERWILSAGHCVGNSWIVRMLPMDAVAGAHDVNNYRPSAQVIPIEQRIKHPLYEGSIGPYDIAVLKTESPFTLTKQVQPIKLPTSSTIRSQHLSLTGWGLLRTTAFIPDMPSKLQEVQVTYVPYNDCHTAINELLEGDETNPLDQEANICTGPLSGGIAACEGDSGGPLVHYLPIGIWRPNDPVEYNTELYNPDYYNCTNEVNTETIDEEGDKGISDRKYKEDLVPVVLGVVSWGISPCGSKGAPTVYTNVSNYINFINYYLNEQYYII